jgi:pimeloyl-ACP methyl ester carboxylesterase
MLLLSCAAPAAKPGPAPSAKSGSAQRARPSAPRVREGLQAIHGTKLFVRDVGPLDAPILLVLHGGPGGNHDSLRPLEALSPAYRVVLYDQRGAGRSARLPVSPSDPASLAKLSLEQNVEDIEALRRKLGRERVALIGHSWGAALAVFYAAAYPAHVDKLIIYSGGPEDLDLAGRKRKAHNALLTAAELAQLKQGVQALGAAVKRDAPQEELDALFVKLASIMFPSLYCQRPASKASAAHGKGGFWANQVVGQYVASFRRETLAPKLKRINAPVLLTWGRCEPSPRERLTWMLDHLPDARFVSFERSGHNAMEEQRELFFKLVRAFLAGGALPLKAHRSRGALPPVGARPGPSR